MPHPIENMLRTTMEQLHQIVDVDTVIGSPVAVDGAVILPVSRVSLGLLTGGGEYEGQGDAARCGRTFDGAGAPYPFTGASALGCASRPSPFSRYRTGASAPFPPRARGRWSG